MNRCKHCGRPVRQTVHNCGYCRKCIREAKCLNETKGGDYVHRRG